MDAQHRYGNGTTEDFTALAEQISGQDLDAFFQIWLYTAGEADPVGVLVRQRVLAGLHRARWACPGTTPGPPHSSR